MSLEIGGDQAEIISIWKGDYGGGRVFTVKFVAKFFLHVLQLEKHWIKDHEEYGGT